MHKIPEKTILIIAIFIAGLCSLVYELLISTTSSYFLGDSVKQFSITIGVYMASMGLGSFISRYINTGLLSAFVIVEIILGLTGGASVPILYYFFETLSREEYTLLMILLTAAVGTLTGLEIPLLARIMKKYYPLKVNLSNLLSLDYLGALFATLIFPFVMLPFFGTFRTSIFFGMVNIFLGYVIVWYFSAHFKGRATTILTITSLTFLISFSALLHYAQPLLQRWNDASFTHKMIFSKQTPYQHLVLTKNKNDIRMYINRIIQFSSLDEYRYHESLGLIPLHAATYKKKDTNSGWR